MFPSVGENDSFDDRKRFKKHVNVTLDVTRLFFFVHVHIAMKSPPFVNVCPIGEGGFPASHVSLQEGTWVSTQK